MEADEGFVLSNKFRKAVFIEIASGEKSVKRIAKKHHIIERMAMKAMDELEGGKLVNKRDDGYVLTDHGKKIFAQLMREDIR
jgi:predicted transcriptional regulator